MSICKITPAIVVFGPDDTMIIKTRLWNPKAKKFSWTSNIFGKDNFKNPGALREWALWGPVDLFDASRLSSTMICVIDMTISRTYYYCSDEINICSSRVLGTFPEKGVVEKILLQHCDINSFPYLHHLYSSMGKPSFATLIASMTKITSVMLVFGLAKNMAMKTGLWKPKAKKFSWTSNISGKFQKSPFS